MEPYIAYFSTHGADWLQMVAEHLQVSACSLAIACAIAVPLGILCARHPLLEKAASLLSGILRIIPSLAVLIFLVPIMGTGVPPAVCALTLLAVPPILINTALAFRTLPADVLEAAAGMGMGPVRTFLTVKVPLAFPAAFAGFRTAATEVVSSATLASYIGAGGLGEIIFTGMGLLRTDLLVIGGASVAALSLAIGQLLALVDRRARRYERAA